MRNIVSALIGGFALLAFSLPVAAFNDDGVRGSVADVVMAKKKCKSGYVYNPNTKKCYPRGSH